jgi:hypothetical protein
MGGAHLTPSIFSISYGIMWETGKIGDYPRDRDARKKPRELR